MRGLPPPWPRRIGGLAIAVVTAGVILAWLGSEPSWLGMVTAGAAIAGYTWFVLDIGDAIADSGWDVHHPMSSERPALDGRLAALRRMADNAGERPPDGGDTRPAAAELQALLREVTERKVRDPTDVPSDLASYLETDPAPLISPARLDQLLTRIETL